MISLFFAKLKLKIELGNMDFVLKVRENYKGCLTYLNMDGILVLCDPNKFSIRIRNRWVGRGMNKFFFEVKNHVLECVSQVLFSQCENKCSREILGFNR